MKKEKKTLRTYLLFYGTQSLSALGSGMTGYALVLWLYLRSGSALQTALLSACSYAPYVVMSIFAGALSDHWNKKRTMLVCDLLAAASTVAALALLKADMLQAWHLYLLNALNGLMNTVQQPAGEVASTLLIPKKYWQKMSGLRSFSQSLNTILTPVLATALFSFGGILPVMAVDLFTFAAAFFTLLLFVQIPEEAQKKQPEENLLRSAKEGLAWLGQNPLILYLILFLASINLAASVYDAALPAMILSKANGGKTVLGVVNTSVGIATLAGSALAAWLPAPKNRVRTIYVSLLISMGENFFLAFGNTPFLWCVGAVLGWLPIPLMSANMDVIFRERIPLSMQGRVYSCRNTLQYFTIPVGLLLGGTLADRVFEPFMARRRPKDGVLAAIFGTDSGSGCALLFLAVGIAGIAICAAFSLILESLCSRLPEKEVR